MSDPMNPDILTNGELDAPIVDEPGIRTGELQEWLEAVGATSTGVVMPRQELTHWSFFVTIPRLSEYGITCTIEGRGGDLETSIREAQHAVDKALKEIPE